ncbi:MAG: hypothetical protein NT042_14605 [Sulfuritalea sp.]|nr:hypothetical protein [Sulfuritalea sp.]
MHRSHHAASLLREAAAGSSAISSRAGLTPFNGTAGTQNPGAVFKGQSGSNPIGVQQELLLAIALHVELQLTHPDMGEIANFGIVGHDFGNQLVLALMRSFIKRYHGIDWFHGGDQLAALMFDADQLVPFTLLGRFAHLPGQSR